MDTISRESNTSSIMPIIGVIVGVLGLVFAAVALAKVTTANKTLVAQSEQMARFDSLEEQVRTAVAAAEKASNGINGLRSSTQDAFNQVGIEIGNLRGEIGKIQEGAKAPAKAASSGTAAKSSEPVVAGANEYVVKSGDNGMKIARETGVSWTDLQAVNPGTNWNSLKIGQKLKLPRK